MLGGIKKNSRACPTGHSGGQAHTHCIVSGGGIDGDNNWKQATNIKGRFLFPVKAMGIVYRAKFLQALYKLIAKAQVTMPANITSPQLFKSL